MSGQYVCVSKAQFFSEVLAQFRADDLNYEYGYDKFSVYKCNCCHFYHLTTQNKNK